LRIAIVAERHYGPPKSAENSYFACQRGVAALLVLHPHMFAVGVNDPNTPHAYVPAIIGTLLTSGWVGQAAVIPVLWTLSAEIGFYILLGIIAATRQGPLGMGRICAAGLVTLFVIWLGASPVFGAFPQLAPALRWTAFIAVYVSYMLIGSTLYIGLYTDRSRMVAGAGVVSSFKIYCRAVLLFSRYLQNVGTDIMGGRKFWTSFVS
jgi:hypothetical protein